MASYHQQQGGSTFMAIPTINFQVSTCWSLWSLLGWLLNVLWPACMSCLVIFVLCCAKEILVLGGSFELLEWFLWLGIQFSSVLGVFSLVCVSSFFFPCLVISWQWPPVLHMFDLLSSKESAIFGRFLWREFLLVFDICSIGTNSGFLSEKRRINSGSLYAFSCGVYRFNLFCECKSKGSQCGSHESVCERGIVGV